MNALDHQDDNAPSLPTYCYASWWDVIQASLIVWLFCGLLGYFVGT